MRRIKSKVGWLLAVLVLLMLVGAVVGLADKQQAKPHSPKSDVRVISAFATLEEMAAFDAAKAASVGEVVPFNYGPAPQAAGPAEAASAAPAVAPPGGGPGPGPGPGLAPPPTTSFQGVIDDGTRIPPDTMGAVGPNDVVEFINTGFTIFDRTGVVLNPQITLQAFWSVLGTLPGQPASWPYDPKILYDQFSNRWVVTADNNPNRRDGTNRSWVLLGISQSSDPNAGFNLFAIDSNSNEPNLVWADYPGLGVDVNNVYITNNMYDVNVVTGGTFQHAKFWVINKAAMIIGGNIAGQFATFRDTGAGSIGGFTWQPCHSFDSTAGGNNYLVCQGWLDNATRTRRFLRMYQVTGIGSAAVFNNFGGNNWLEVNSYNFAILDAPQTNCTVEIETNDPRLLNAVLRNGKIWTTHHVGAGTFVVDPSPASMTEIAWYECNPAAFGAFPGAWANQQGRVVGFGDPPAFYYYPSIAVNNQECVALGFSGSHSSMYVSAYYTMRKPTDPPGQMDPEFLYKAGEAPYLKQFSGTRNRWGDFSATVVDPLDDTTFWTVQEYASNTSVMVPCVPDGGKWGTWWASFPCEACFKWEQLPDETENGIDIRCDRIDGGPPVILADDYNCTNTGPITDVTFWGSWKDDDKGQIEKLHLSIHSDDPCGQGGSDPANTYSMPDQLLWQRNFSASDINETLYKQGGDPEWWWDPANSQDPIQACDYQIWQYDIVIDDSNRFIQQGDACNPVIYWLDIYVELDDYNYPGTEFGWKTSLEHWNDDAVWSSDDGLTWNDLHYPLSHPYNPDTIDLSFKIVTGEEEPNYAKPLAPHTKWSQPPIEIDPCSDVPTYCGWDEESHNKDYIHDPCTWKIVADDFRCIGSMPVTSIHWWGSFYGWMGPETLPTVLPKRWWIGFWNNVPAQVPPFYLTYSCPNTLVHEITIDASRVEWMVAGSDEYFGEKPTDICFQYYVDLRPEEVFWQDDFNETTTNDIYWISIVAEYNDLDQPSYKWGWKSRSWHWMDDAVTFNLPSKLPAGSTIPDPFAITPIKDVVFLESMDMAFELDTDPNYIKWEQLYTGIRHWWHYEDVNSMFDLRNPDEEQMVADDWRCLRRTPVIAIAWWGSYIGYRSQACSYPPFMSLPVKPDRFVLKIWTDVAADDPDNTYSYSHPGEEIWQYDAFEFDEVMVGFDKHPHGAQGQHPNEPVFRYSVRLPKDEWFNQPDYNEVFWFSVQAVYENQEPLYPWGWTNHEHVFNDNAVRRYEDLAAGGWVWEELYDQTGKSEDMSFILFTDPHECSTCANYNTDWIINCIDYADFADDWYWVGPAGGYNNSDLNCDGVADNNDLKIFALQWLTYCP